MSTEQQNGHFKYLVMVIGAVGLFVAVIGFMVVNNSQESAPAVASDSDPMSSPAAENTTPYGMVAVAGESVAEVPAVAAAPMAGDAVYEKVCALCHTPGAAGAPKLGDEAAWAARIDQGMDVLYEHAIKGFAGESGIMPAKGGMASLSDDEVKAAVNHMVAQSGGEIAETEGKMAEEAPAVAAAGGDNIGETTYNNVCTACHAPAMAKMLGAPALGSADDWSTRTAQGKDTLYDHAINGFQGEKGVMPAKGGMTSLSDEEVKAAVDYMVEQSGGYGDADAAAAPAAMAEAPATADTALGEKTFNAVCTACHAPAMAKMLGAPAQGNADDWEPRLAKGMETLYDHAINGFQGEKGVMPAKGGMTSLSDEEVKAAVDYMVQ